MVALSASNTELLVVFNIDMPAQFNILNTIIFNTSHNFFLNVYYQIYKMSILAFD